MSELVVVRNPFDRRHRDVRPIPAGRVTVAALVGEYLPAGASAGVELVVSVNGSRLPQEQWSGRVLEAHDQMVVMPVIHGDDDGGFLAVIASVALMVVAPQLAPALYSALGGTYVMASAPFMIAALQVGISLVGNAIIGALTAPERPSLPGARTIGSFDSSPAYGWQPVTTQVAGAPIARSYGKIKLYGNVIAGYIENTDIAGTSPKQRADMLVDLGLGPVAALTDYKINDQPIANYAGVTVIERRGNLNQEFIPRFNDTRLTYTINAKIVKGSPVERVTEGSNFDSLEIRVGFLNGIYYANEQGGLSTHTVRLLVELSGDGGVTWSLLSHSIDSWDANKLWTEAHWSLGFWQTDQGTDGNPARWVEIWADPLPLNYAARNSGQPSSGGGVEVPALGAYLNGTWQVVNGWVFPAANLTANASFSYAQTQPVRWTFTPPYGSLTRGNTYTVRVSNLTDDQTSSRYGDDAYLTDIVEVLYDDFQYPRAVLAGVAALATDQLSGSIKFSCVSQGSYIRTWNGAAWVVAANNNPAWVCWDILTQPVLDNTLAVVRYDGFDPSRLDLASFYAWAQWCDELVPDGEGGTERRSMFNAVFDTMTSMWDAALEVCNSARATLFFRGTVIAVVFDHARTAPAQVFNVGNTAVSGFEEVFLPMADRASVIEVEFLNEKSDYARDRVTVVDTTTTESASARVQVANRGITRASQAWREARYRLERNRLIRRTAELSVDIDALACTVGDLVWVQSDVPRWGEGGRVVGGTSTSVTLDKSVTVVEGKTYDLVVRYADDAIATRAITSPAGTYTAIDVAELPSAPALHDLWAFGETGVAVKPFIVTDVSRDGAQRARLALAEYNASLYNVDSDTPTLPTANYAYAPVPAATNLTAEESYERRADGSYRTRLTFRWDLNADAASAHVSYTWAGGSYSGQQSRIISGAYTIDDAQPGMAYTIRVIPQYITGATAPRAAWQYLTVTATGPDLPVITSATCDETLVVAAGAVVSKATVAWVSDVTLDATEIRWRMDGGAWSAVSTVRENSFAVIFNAPGFFEAQITPLKGLYGSVFNVSKLLAGKAAAPADVAGLTFNVQRSQATLSWTPSTDLDVIVGGYMVIRYAAQFDAAWEEGIELPPLPGTASSTSLQSLASGTWLARWLDSSGHYSDTAAAVNVYSMPTETRLALWNADTAWPGAKYNTVVDTGRLTLDGVNTVGTYRDAAYDYGLVCTGGVEVACIISTYSTGLIDDFTALMDTWGDLDGVTTTGVAVSLWIRTTNDDPAGAPAWSDFRQFYGRENFTARAFQVELRIGTDDLAHNAFINSMTVNALIDRQTLYGADVVSGAATKSISYGANFINAPAIGITPQDMATGDYYVITDRTASGFDITFKNSAGTAVSRTFDWIANGY